MWRTGVCQAHAAPGLCGRCTCARRSRLYTNSDPARAKAAAMGVGTAPPKLTCATSRGVRPWALLMFGCARASRSSWTCMAFPVWHAAWSGVRPSHVATSAIIESPPTVWVKSRAARKSARKNCERGFIWMLGSLALDKIMRRISGDVSGYEQMAWRAVAPWEAVWFTSPPAASSRRIASSVMSGPVDARISELQACVSRLSMSSEGKRISQPAMFAVREYTQAHWNASQPPRPPFRVGSARASRSASTTSKFETAMAHISGVMPFMIPNFGFSQFVRCSSPSFELARRSLSTATLPESTASSTMDRFAFPWACARSSPAMSWPLDDMYPAIDVLRPCTKRWHKQRKSMYS
mmetsp:Transcript_110509/g.312593  ORF Transcript_110509/g.312593 Transcript_110509/m.312593 type:complete len:351 (+) Transcript_110509:105-1157(+)